MTVLVAEGLGAERNRAEGITEKPDGDHRMALGEPAGDDRDQNQREGREERADFLREAGREQPCGGHHATAPAG